ncbi:hypothetical protein M9Y10_016972 [Tritrichomonas musculus]|uniref:HECT-type E3 ubiquitin transferase n=1 Tax=Tritrichomonas musculus TaxID=1915356 RepID=A0ABR2HXQ0_9EUKA
MNQETPLTSTVNEVTERDLICQLLKIATKVKIVSYDLVFDILKKLANNHMQNGDDYVVESLFFSYITSCKEEISRNFSSVHSIQYSRTMSQYEIAFLLIIFPKRNINFKNKLILQSWKILTNDDFDINNIKISKFLSYSLLRYLCNYFDNDWVLDYKKIETNNLINDFFNNLYHPLNISSINEEDNTIDAYATIDFWKNIISNNDSLENLSINVNDDTYRFNMAAIFKFLNTNIKINYNINNFAFQDSITCDIAKLIKTKLELNELLEYRSLSSETKNLCTLIAFLIMNNTSLEKLKSLEESMNPRSFMILMLIYSNYSDEISAEYQIELIKKNIDIKNSNDFILLSILLNKMKENKITDFSGLPKDIATIDEEENQSNSNLFSIMIEKDTNILKAFIKNNEIDAIYSLFKNATNTERFVKFIKEDRQTLKDLKKILLKIQFKRDTPCNFLKETKLIDLFQLHEKQNLCINPKFTSRIEMRVHRNKVLYDSINFCKNKQMKNKIISVKYLNENGIDGGGLKRDWFTSVSQRIIESGVFVPVPSGFKLTFNEKKFNYNIVQFTGKLIALSILNKVNIPIKLTSWIWKGLLNEKVTLEDMKDYDSEIYHSLKWIAENDPEPLMMTFVNSSNCELCPNGSNIDLNESNKNEYINLMIHDILDKKFISNINALKSGFAYCIYMRQFSMFIDSNDLRRIVNGTDYINVNEWKRNTLNPNHESRYFNDFFRMISKWPQEKLKKLLKFITGSSQVPFNGFRQYKYDGGQIKLCIIRESERLPIAHTCYNSLELPKYKDLNILERKLSMAIDCQSFEIE